MDVGKSFTFVFEDKEWVAKLGIAALILLVGILFFWVLLIPLIAAIALLLGYGVEITRRVIRGEPVTLPAWDNWGALAADGLRFIVVGVVYALPIIVVSACLGAITAPLSNSGSTGLAALGALFSALLGLVDFVWGIAISILLPAAVALWVDTGDFAAAFRFSEVWNLVRNNLGTYLITWLMTWVAQVIGHLGAIVCGIGWFVTVPYSMMVTGHLYGQAYLAARKQSASPAPTPTA